MPAYGKILSETPDHERGQILPLGLALLLCACFGLFLFISLGRVVVAREQHRMQVDLTVEAGAISLARCLNLVAAINKAQAVIFSALTLVGELEAAKVFQRATCLFIDAGVKVAPLVPEATMAYVGWQNGLVPIPIWFSGGSDGGPSPLPQLNLERRYAPSFDSAVLILGDEYIEGKTGASSSSTSATQASSNQSSEPHYSYKSEETGQEITVDSSQVEKVVIHQKNGSTRVQARQRDPSTGKVKFVKETPGFQNFPLDIEETGPHRLTVIGRASNTDLYDSLLLPRPPAQWVIASAEAGGGDVRLVATSPNADFDAYLIPVARGLGVGDGIQEIQNGLKYARELGIPLPMEIEGWTQINQ